VELARRSAPDLVVLDVMMPGLDGFGVVRRLRGDGIRVPVLFLTARDATEDKGAWHLAESYRELSDPPPLVLVGRNYLDELADRPGVHMVGAWPHALAIEALRRSLFAVAPSLWPEPFGLVALESAAAGKAIIASDIGGLHDIVLDGETGLLVPPGDRAALIAALRRMTSDEALRARLGEAARARAETFSPEAIVPQFEEAYGLAIESRRARQPSMRG